MRVGETVEISGRPVAVTGCSHWCAYDGPGGPAPTGARVSGIDEVGATVLAVRGPDGWEEL